MRASTTTLLGSAMLGQVAMGASIPKLHNRATPAWEVLPPTPTLPGNPTGNLTKVNGVDIWHAEFGTQTSGQTPILFLHGGFGNANYWGAVIELLMKDNYIIAMDTRGHGRSTMDSTPFTYSLYASDAAGLLSSLGISKAAWVGWSDMGAGTLAGLQDATVAATIDRAFVYGGFHSVDSTNASYTSTAIYTEFVTRAAKEYVALQPNGNLTALEDAIVLLESTQPNWSADDLGKIALGGKVTISAGVHEEAVVLTEPAFLNGAINGSRLVMQDGVSHFGAVQDPEQFAEKVAAFLK